MFKFICLAVALIPQLSLANSVDDYLRVLAKEHKITPLELIKTENPSLFKLGQKLYSDNILSGNKNISCQTCHNPQFATGDGLPLPIGEGGTGEGTERRIGNGHIVPRNGNPVFNLGHFDETNMFWDGRVSFNKKMHSFVTPVKELNGTEPILKEYCVVLTSALAAQAMFPPTSHHEMRGEAGENEIADAKNEIEVWEKLTARVVAVKEYRELIKKAYKNISSMKQVNFAHLANAIAEFEKVEFQTPNTPFDRFLRGENEAMSFEEKRGAITFMEKAKCVQCHNGPLLSDMKFHAVFFPQIGPGKEEGGDDKGRFNITGDEKDLYKFRTPPLRNVAKTGPWGHAGGMFPIRDILLHYFHPMRTWHHYDPDFSGYPYELPVERDNLPARFKAIDPIIGRGIPLDGQDFLDLELFLTKSLTQE